MTPDRVYEAFYTGTLDGYDFFGNDYFGVAVMVL